MRTIKHIGGHQRAGWTRPGAQRHIHTLRKEAGNAECEYELVQVSKGSARYFILQTYVTELSGHEVYFVEVNGRSVRVTRTTSATPEELEEIKNSIKSAEDACI